MRERRARLLAREADQHRLGAADAPEFEMTWTTRMRLGTASRAIGRGTDSCARSLRPTGDAPAMVMHQQGEAIIGSEPRQAQGGVARAARACRPPRAAPAASRTSPPTGTS